MVGSYLLDTGASSTIVHTDNPRTSTLSSGVPYSPRGEGNQRAREGARSRKAWDPYEEGQVGAARKQPREKESDGVVLAPDLTTVQAQDPILKAASAAICRQEKIEGPFGGKDQEQTRVDVETVGEPGESTGSQPEVAGCVPGRGLEAAEKEADSSPP